MIDPATLRSQRLSLVAPSEGKCSVCGKRTRDRTGMCVGCRNSAPKNLQRMTLDQLTGLIAACKAELKRRRDAIDGAMEGA